MRMYALRGRRRDERSVVWVGGEQERGGSG